MRVTLDTNAIIALENDEPAGAAVRHLIRLSRDGLITLCVSAIAAGEQDRAADGSPDFSRFEARLIRCDLADVELLNPTMHWDITYWDHCVWGASDDNLEAAIGAILFPNLDLKLMEAPNEPDFDKTRWIRRARNALCDILGMWCHIRHGGHIFVSSDENFHRSKKAALVALGAGQILRPAEAVAIL